MAEYFCVWPVLRDKIYGHSRLWCIAPGAHHDKTVMRMESL